jgi:pilus assembly protein CpaE
LAAVTRALKKRGVSVPSGAAGKVLTFLPCKGGSGATFLAANIAYVLASEQNLRVALIDLNLQFGDAALYLSEKRAPSDIGELSVNIARLDLSLLESAMLSVDTRLSILAAPEDPARAADVRPEHVEAIIRLAQRHYDVVVVDVGRSLDAVSLRALDLANLILPVLQLTLTSVRDARRMFDVFSSLGYAHGKVRFIVNRFEKGGEISLDTAAKALGDVICDTVPNSYAAVIASINLGNPILKQQRNNPVSRALVELARDLIPSAQQVAAGGGWLTRVFGAR